MIKDFNLKPELLTIKKLPIFHLATIFFLSFLVFILVSGNSVQSKTDTQSQTYKNLMGIGISSIREWSNCESWAKRTPAVGSVEEYSQVLTDGWRTLNFIVCAQEHFSKEGLDKKLARTKLEAIRQQIRILKQKFPDRTFVVTFKGYAAYKDKRWEDGTKITKLYDKIRRSDKIERGYLQWWMLATEVFNNDRSIVFWLMNEPDYRFKGGLDYVLKLSTKTVDEIRKKNPDRWIILNGFSRSLVGRGRSVFEIMRPLDRDNIVYGFHLYGLKGSKYNRRDFVEKNVISDISQWDRQTKNALNEITQFKQRYGVPVMLTEVGVVAKTKYVKKGVESKERGRFFKEVIKDWSDKCGCGILIWALGDDNTPYVRQRLKKKGAPEYGYSEGFDPRPVKGMPLLRDEILLKALGLNDYFIFKKSKVKELQKLLKAEGYEVGEIDGILGKKTEDAILAWYKKKKIRFNKKTSNKLEYLIALESIKNSKR